MDDVVKEKEETKKTDISQYLATPRKKRKNFVVMAMGPNFPKAYTEKIDSFVKRNYPQLAVSHPHDIRELARQFSRNISLLIIDDSFSEMEKIMATVTALKMKTKRDVAPVLFMTQDPSRLVDSYQKRLIQYQESDDYCDLTKMNASQIIGRVKIGIENRNRRKGRRYNINIPISFYHLTKDKSFKAKIIDLSICGALITAEGLDHFALSDQLKISVPSGAALGPGRPEFVHFGAKVRRVFVGGSTAGISFENMTEHQELCLTKILSSIARDDLVK